MSRTISIEQTHTGASSIPDQSILFRWTLLALLQIQVALLIVFCQLALAQAFDPGGAFSSLDSDKGSPGINVAEQCG